MSYDNTNRGAIWKNERKESDKHPDFTGKLDVNGVSYRVAAWKRQPGASLKAPALSFRVEPEDQRQNYQKPDYQKPVQPDFDDDIGF